MRIIESASAAQSAQSAQSTQSTQSAQNLLPETDCFTSYREVVIDDKHYRVTSVFKGNLDLKNALEELTVRRVLRDAADEAVLL